MTQRRRKLLEAMGYETANVHLSSATSNELSADLKARPDGWLKDASKEMAYGVLEDFESWRGIGK
ncbi:MAG: hypothetical protein WD557_15670 [Dehalococcoidia bacterium]